VRYLCCNNTLSVCIGLFNTEPIRVEVLQYKCAFPYLHNNILLLLLLYDIMIIETIDDLQYYMLRLVKVVFRFILSSNKALVCVLYLHDNCW